VDEDNVDVRYVGFETGAITIADTGQLPAKLIEFDELVVPKT
jgi:hypothetical protein